MHIYHISEKINELAGGTSVHICKLAEATANENQGTVEIAAFNLRHKGGLIKTPPNVRVQLFEPRRPYLYGKSLEFESFLKKVTLDPDSVFHVHNMWRLPLVAACKYAHKNNRPCVISPHGALNPWALSVKSVRKKVLWRLVEEPRLKNATVLRATSMSEAGYLAELVPGVPVAVIPPGTDLPEIVESRTSNSTRTALFLSRIAPNKGLLILLKAWAAIRPKDWRLVVAGSSEGGHQEECQRAVKQYKLEDSITFVGSAFQDKKWGQYFGADLFILPTLSENFGIAVAEALACGIPVITTKGAPWEELENYKCGWWIEIGVDPLIAAMKQAFALNIQELKEMGLRGRKLIEQKYTWPMIARKMLTVYKWAMGDGQRPECIKFG